MRGLTLWLGLALATPALAATTQWAGFYTCAQGATALKLTLIDDDPSRVTAVFAFGPTPANPDLPRGSYTLRGTRRGAQVELTPDAWLERPEGYEMVGLNGGMAGTRFEGRILFDGCGRFALERQGG